MPKAEQACQTGGSEGGSETLMSKKKIIQIGKM